MMKKHLRLFAIFAASFSLVGVMAGAALAAINVSETAVTLAYDDNTDAKAVTITITNTGPGLVKLVAGEVSKLKDGKNADIDVIDVSTYAGDLPENGTKTFTIKTKSTSAVGTAKIKICSGDINTVAKTVSVTITPIAPTGTGLADADKDLAKMYDSTYQAIYAGKTYADPSSKTVKITFNSNRLGKYSAAFTSTNKKAPAFPATALALTSTDFNGGKKELTYTFKGFKAPDVTEDTDYTLTFTASDEDEEMTELAYDFTVYAAPKITNDDTKEPKAKIVWGDTKGWNFEVKGTNVDKFLLEDEATTKKFTNGEATYWGVTFDDGAFTVDGAWKSATTSTDFTWTGTELTKKVKVIALRGLKSGGDATKIADYGVSADKTFTLTFQGAAPKFSQAESSYTYDYDKTTPITPPTAANPENLIIVEGPGTITLAPDKASQKALEALGLSWTALNTVVPEGFTKDTFVGGYFSGTPNKTATKGTAITLEASNPYSKKSGKNTTFKTTVIITADKVEFAAADNATAVNDTVGLTKNMLVGDKVNFTLTAAPGPITWKATNLPAGVTLTPNAKDPTKATVAGTVTTATKDLTSEKNTFTITAANSDFKDATAAEISGDVLVWAKPTFKTDPKKTLSAKTGENGINISVVTDNPVVEKGWTVKLGETALVTTGQIQTNGFKFAAGTAAHNAALAGTSEVTADSDALGNGVLTLSGSFDRVPNGGKELPMTVTVAVPKRGNNSADVTNTATGNFKIQITGDAPKFAKADWTIDDTALTYELEPTAGTPAITLTAEIDAATAKKFFDASSKITLGSTADSTYTGLKFEDAAAAVKDGTGKFTYSSSVKDVAFKKLPITITAANKDVSAKDTTFKMTVTREGTAPTWELSAVPTATIFYPAGEDTYAVSKGITEEYSGKLNYNVKAGVALTGGLVLKSVGSFPLKATVKPESKNGITATVGKISNADAHPTVTFSGTPSAVNKDTATKFTVELTNPSTGKKDKIDVTFTILPKPKAAATTITAKPVVYGKNVKVAPKLTATNKNLTWYVTKVSADTITTPATEAGATSAAGKLETYGLTFDAAKGIISGTTAYATGKDSPLKVIMVASGDLETSEEVTASITVLGEPVKLTTKTVPFSVGENVSDVETTEALTVKTNLSDATETNRANVTWTYKAPAEIKGLTLTKSTGNAPGVSATAAKGDSAKVTKKAKVEITFDNYGTTTKGKLAFTVDGATPAIGDVTVPTIKAGASKTVNLSVSNNSKLSDKLKWKVTTKPSVKGVSVSVKGGTNGKAVLTIKVGGKVEESSASVGVTVTDALTKKPSEEKTFEIPIDPYVPTTADAPEVLSELGDHGEVLEEKIALGEGEVHMGVQRTAGSLTAGQRAFIEQQGYIIAAVLPEIEVTADGQYDFEVDLDKKVATGAELVWFAFASKPTPDDEIVDFADEECKETEVVPESHVVIVYPWLNAGTKYAPVIAVKAEAGEEDAKTEEALKEAAEQKAE